ncbi:type II secretion system F family protein [Kineosporia babensis]|uniref:Type II secretion system F family protein n=1 Tax=Kineosporia babensis TaxID=499548 RepID=A0A9X1NM29_9ACTN|nr:type II secretion system F family protein [Kineosporia babensis]MCD5316845.1 type II secretion system F family protein [Kineosporia babensis]
MTFEPYTLLTSALLAFSLVAVVNLLVNELRGHLAPASSEQQRDLAGRTGFREPGVGRAWVPLVVRIVAAVAVAALVGWFTGWPVAALACAVAVMAWPVLGGGRRGERHDIEVLEAIVVWTQGLRDTVAGGASLEQAIGVSVEGAPEVLRPSLQEVRSRMLVRQTLDHALRPLQAVPGADFVVAALILAARRRGDRLPDVLSGIVTTSAHEVAQRRQILAARAGIHRSVQIIIGVTVAILVWMATVGAAYMAPYDSWSGQGVLAIVMAVLAAGFIWLIRLDTTSTIAGFLADKRLSAREHQIVMTLARRPVQPVRSVPLARNTGKGTTGPAGHGVAGAGADENGRTHPW